jgi:arylsulfatase A-like enzyme
VKILSSIVLSLVLAFWWQAAAGTPTSVSPPNILLLVVDDMGYGDFLDAEEGYRLPVMRELAAAGVSFRRLYTDSVCAPSRISLLTGQPASRLGFRSSGPGISADVPTLPRSLQAAGYDTSHVGKWHIGHLQREAWPDRQGFDRWTGFLSQYLLQGSHTEREFHYAKPGYHNPHLSSEQFLSRQFTGHLTDILTEHTVQLIRERGEGSTPWFINHWFYAPHQPLQPAVRYAEDATTPAELYQAQLQQLNDSIKRILAALEASKQAANTLVILTSDNGGSNLAQANNAFLAGQKGSFSEGGLRVPLIMRLPGRLPAGEWRNQVASLQDIYPTVLEVAGVEPVATISGQSLLPLVDNPGLERQQPLFWEAPFLAGQAVSMLSADGRWRFAAYRAPGQPPVELLYDLENNPAGDRNVVASQSGQRASMASRLEEWTRQVHRLPLEYTALGSNGRARLQGLDLQRVPGFGPFTLALSFVRARTPGGLQRHVIAAQNGVWELAYQPSNRQLTLTMGDMRIQAALPESGTCHSVLLSGMFRVKLSPANSDSGQLRLFLDGALAGEASSSSQLIAIADITQSTAIGQSIDGGHVFAGQIGLPAQYNVLPERYSWLDPAYLHSAGCAALSP